MEVKDIVTYITEKKLPKGVCHDDFVSYIKRVGMHTNKEKETTEFITERLKHYNIQINLNCEYVCGTTMKKMKDNYVFCLLRGDYRELFGRLPTKKEANNMKLCVQGLKLLPVMSYVKGDGKIKMKEILDEYV